MSERKYYGWNLGHLHTDLHVFGSEAARDDWAGGRPTAGTRRAVGSRHPIVRRFYDAGPTRPVEYVDHRPDRPTKRNEPEPDATPSQ